MEFFKITNWIPYKDAPPNCCERFRILPKISMECIFRKRDRIIFIKHDFGDTNFSIYIFEGKYTTYLFISFFCFKTLQKTQIIKKDYNYNGACQNLMSLMSSLQKEAEIYKQELRPRTEARRNHGNQAIEQKKDV